METWETDYAINQEHKDSQACTTTTTTILLGLIQNDPKTSLERCRLKQNHISPDKQLIKTNK